jgi:hypothetical protein
LVDSFFEPRGRKEKEGVQRFYIYYRKEAKGAKKISLRPLLLCGKTLVYFLGRCLG